MFRNRSEAGKSLAAQLIQYRDRRHTIILALPRGGVPVGYEIAVALHLPLDVFVVRKLGVPGQAELAMGALAAGGTKVINRQVVEVLSLSNADIDAVIAREQRELDRRLIEYRDDLPWPNVRDWTVILVDDGLATGATMRAAVAALRQQGPARIVVAVPVGAADTCELVADEADKLICLEQPDPFRAVGIWYQNFEATTDEEVRTLLDRNKVDWPFQTAAN